MNPLKNQLIFVILAIVLAGCATGEKSASKSTDWQSQLEPRFSGVFDCPGFSGKTTQGYENRFNGTKKIIELRKLGDTWIYSEFDLERAPYKPGSLEDKAGPYNARSIVADGLWHLFPLYRNNTVIPMKIKMEFDGSVLKFESQIPDYVNNEGKKRKGHNEVATSWVDKDGSLMGKGTYSGDALIVCTRVSQL